MNISNLNLNLNLFILTYFYLYLDSLVYNIITDDFYNDLLNKPGLLDRMDTSNLPNGHPCFISKRKKVPGFFSDETEGQPITEFVALRAKSYAFAVDGKENIKAKGIRKHVVKNHMNLEDHKRCLFGDNTLQKYRQNVSIRSFKHTIHTIRSKKLTYNCKDDKRFIQEDGIHTLAHGHYLIPYVK